MFNCKEWQKLFQDIAEAAAVQTDSFSVRGSCGDRLLGYFKRRLFGLADLTAQVKSQFFGFEGRLAAVVKRRNDGYLCLTHPARLV